MRCDDRERRRCVVVMSFKPDENGLDEDGVDWSGIDEEGKDK